MREIFWKAFISLSDDSGKIVCFDSLDDEDCAKIADAIRRGFDCGKIKVDY